jgi:hypothetical protein
MRLMTGLWLRVANVSQEMDSETQTEKLELGNDLYTISRKDEQIARLRETLHQVEMFTLQQQQITSDSVARARVPEDNAHRLSSHVTDRHHSVGSLLTVIQALFQLSANRLVRFQSRAHIGEIQESYFPSHGRSDGEEIDDNDSL